MGASLQITDTLPLATYEAVCSIDSMEFADDSSIYYVVGTAVAVPEEPEPTKVSAFCLCQHANYRYVTKDWCCVRYLSDDSPVAHCCLMNDFVNPRCPPPELCHLSHEISIKKRFVVWQKLFFMF